MHTTFRYKNSWMVQLSTLDRDICNTSLQDLEELSQAEELAMNARYQIFIENLDKCVTRCNTLGVQLETSDSHLKGKGNVTVLRHGNGEFSMLCCISSVSGPRTRWSCRRKHFSWMKTSESCCILFQVVSLHIEALIYAMARCWISAQEFI